MNFNKEKARLENLLIPIAGVEIYNEENYSLVNEAYLEYSKVIRLLFNNRPNVFGNLYNYDLKTIKDNKQFIKKSFTEEAQQTNFIVFKDSIVHAVERTLEYISEYVLS
ncbi:hypothetical protein ACSBL2_14870 [Pedobacter sp. AW31-3R]|uniref:hypothetical protein n=1 Tax=Pedobacter sp. AW31-3R TaxID=3445781 RepID=UPI003F9EDE3B